MSLARRCVSSWLSTTMSSSAGASSISPSPSKTRCHGRSVRSSRTTLNHVSAGRQLCGLVFFVCLGVCVCVGGSGKEEVRER